MPGKLKGRSWPNLDGCTSLSVADSPALSWDDLDGETDAEQMGGQLQSVLTQVRCRMAR